MHPAGSVLLVPVGSGGILRVPSCSASAVPDADGGRIEQLRLRLPPEDLRRIACIQAHYESVGLPSSLTRVVSDSILHFFDDLVAEGAIVPPDDL